MLSSAFKTVKSYITGTPDSENQRKVPRKRTHESTDVSEENDIICIEEDDSPHPRKKGKFVEAAKSLAHWVKRNTLPFHQRYFLKNTVPAIEAEKGTRSEAGQQAPLHTDPGSARSESLSLRRPPVRRVNVKRDDIIVIDGEEEEDQVTTPTLITDTGRASGKGGSLIKPKTNGGLRSGVRSKQVGARQAAMATPQQLQQDDSPRGGGTTGHKAAFKVPQQPRARGSGHQHYTRGRKVRVPEEQSSKVASPDLQPVASTSSATPASLKRVPDRPAAASSSRAGGSSTALNGQPRYDLLNSSHSLPLGLVSRQGSRARGGATPVAPAVHSRIFSPSPTPSPRTSTSSIPSSAGNLSRKQSTIQQCVKLEEKELYRQLLQQYTSQHLDTTIPGGPGRESPAPLSGLFTPAASDEVFLGNSLSRSSFSTAPPPPTVSKVRVEAQALFPSSRQTLNAAGKAGSREEKRSPHHRSLNSSTSAPVASTSSYFLRTPQRTPLERDASDSLEVISLGGSTASDSQASHSSRPSSSLEKTFSKFSIYNEDWIKSFKEKYNPAARERQRKLAEEEAKAKIFLERRLEQEKRIEEKILKDLRRAESEPAVVEDVRREEAGVDEFPPLTGQMQSVIDNALSVFNNGDEVLSDKYNIPLKRRDMQTLDGLNWLNDEVVNFYFNLITERSGKKEGLPKIHSFNTFFYPKLVKQGYTMLRRWTRKVDLFAMKLVLVPIHLGMHWCLAVIDFREKSIKYFDSMGGQNNDCLNTLREYLEQEHMDKKKSRYDTGNWQLRTVQQIPQQQNGSDCGVFACKFAENISRDAPINFTQEHMPYIRRRMVWEIISQELMV